ncbi:MAG: hypothetical protein RL092_1430 [Bacteroidota bacterium]|jgi:hypothetical protein
MNRYIFIFILGLSATLLSAQEKVTTVGFQIKPIFASKFFGTGAQEIEQNDFNYKISQNTGFSGGLIIRKGYTKSLSLEFGINYSRRNVTIETLHQGISSVSKMKIIGYEIPLSQLIFVRLSKNIFMNVSAGACINMFPSDVQATNEVLYAIGGRKLIFNPSLIANLGFEYRSADKGYFYLGTSFNRPFSPIYGLGIDYVVNSVVVNSAFANLQGSYLTLDFKYFFHEDPERKKAKLPSDKQRSAKPKKD